MSVPGQAPVLSLGPRLFAAALARAEAFLFEPVEPADPEDAPAPPAARDRPLVVVAGIVPACGATTVARALAAELALRDPIRSAVVCGADARGSLPIGTPAAGRLARLVSARTGVDARASGRICLAAPIEPAEADLALRGLAAVVLDADSVAAAGAPASVADRVVLVAAPAVEPALAAVVAASLERVGPEPIVALNRAPDDPDPAGGNSWEGRADVILPTSHAAARLALAGRGAAGAFGAAIAELADLCEPG
jgi:hypothetical protein